MPKTDLTKTINILSNPLYIFVIFLGCGLLVFLILMLKQTGFKKPQGSLDYFQVQIQDKEKTIILNKDGRVEFKTPTTSLQQQWDEDKLNAVLKIIKDELENQNEFSQDSYEITLIGGEGSFTFKISKENQTLTDIFNFFNSTQPGGETIGNEWFNRIVILSPSPSSSGMTGSGSGDSEGGVPAGNSPVPGECPMWLLGMCVYPRNWVFSPAPSPSLKPPSPLPSGEKPKPQKSPAVPDCTLWNQLITGKTVISNTLCIK